MPTSKSEFSGLRAYLWPIHVRELKKFIPMQLILFFICFNYSLLRNLKDSITITASGAEVIPFIKVWLILPMAVLFTWLYARLSNRFSQETVFYILVGGFLSYYAIFTYVLYPLRDQLHPHESAQAMMAMWPKAKWFFAMYENWIFSTFYVLAELWSSVVLSVLFWGFANEVTKISEASRFYSVFSVGSNIAAAIAGLATALFLGGEGIGFLNITFAEDKELAWEQSLKIIMTVVIIGGLIAMALYWWLNRYILNDPSYASIHTAFSEEQTPVKGKKKKRLSLSQSFRYLMESKYLICIAILVVSYNLVINLVEVVWKDQLRRLYPNSSDYMTYMSYLTFTMGIISTTTSFFMARIIGKFGWTTTALITPLLMLVTSIGFFTFMFFQDALSLPVIALTGTTPLAIAVFFGFLQNCTSKAAKYSVFDATKEMAFIPLDHESKIKGKAAIDGVGSRLGKSGGSLIHAGLLMLFTTLSSSAPYVAAILFAVIFVWITATKSLGKQFHDILKSQGEKPLDGETEEEESEKETAALPA